MERIVWAAESQPLDLSMAQNQNSPRKRARQSTKARLCCGWLVGPDGRTHDIRIQQSLGIGLDEKAIEVIRQWKFEPGRKDGSGCAGGC